MSTEIKVASLGESIESAGVGTWEKNVGDIVAVGDVIVTLETDKAALEIQATTAGTIQGIMAQTGDEVKEGDVLCVIGEGGAAAASAPAAAPASAPAAVASGGAAATEVRVASLGESIDTAGVGAWEKNVGDIVAVGDVIVTLETDKAALEIQATAAGTIQDIAVQTGDDVKEGDLLCVIAAGAAGAGAAPAAAAPAAAPSAAPVAASASGAPAVTGEMPKMSPAVRKLVTEYNVDPSMIPATGRGGRLTREDVIAAAQAKKSLAGTPGKPAAAAPAAADTQDRSLLQERVKMSRLRQTVARRLKQAQENAAMLTTFNEVDMSNAMQVRSEYKDLFEKKHGVRLGFMSFFVKAATIALKELPAVNAEIDGDEIIYKNYCDIGVAVGAPQGLVVPVVRGADNMEFWEIEKTIGDYGRKARDGKITPADMSGGTFTISNGGVYGSLMSTPILNPPQSGILGMHKIQQRPVAVNGQVEIRPMMYVALSYDHRIIDGKEAVTFLVRLKDCVEDPRRLLLDL